MAAATLLAAPAYADDGYDAPTNVTLDGQTCSINADAGRIPSIDRHELEKDDVRGVTLAASTDRIAVAVYGRDGRFVQAVMQAVYDARACGLNVGGLTFGTATEPSGIDIYADHIRTHEVHGITDQLDADNAELWRSGVLEALMRADAQLRQWQAEENAEPVTTAAAISLQVGGQR